MIDRIQRKRVKGWRMPDNTKYVGRGSKWGNPFAVGSLISIDRLNELGVDYSPLVGIDGNVKCTLELAIKAFEAHLLQSHLKLDDLLGFDHLACWCSLDNQCHADIILKHVNNRYKEIKSAPDQERFRKTSLKSFKSLFK